MNIRTVSQRYETRGLKDRPCSTAAWRRDIEWTSLRKWYTHGGKHRRAALDRLLAVHGKRLPAVLYPGREVTSSLEDQLFPDTVFLMTGCGSQGPWDPPRPGRARLHTLIGFPNAF